MFSKFILPLSFIFIVLSTTSCGPGLCTGDGDCRFGEFNEIGMFLSNATHTGNLGGRTGADTICRGSVPPGYAHFPEIRAFLSVNTTGDDIKSMPLNYKVPTTKPIRFNGNQFLADNWSDLLDSSIFGNPGGGGAAGDYWTGSTATGDDFAVGTCLSWTDGSGGNSGRVGDRNSFTGSWIDNAGPVCSTPHYVICVGYYPTH